MLVRAIAPTLLAFALLPAAVAAAEAAPTIATPTNGSVTVETTPEFSGTANGTLEVVTLTIYPGSSPGGSPAESPSLALPEEGVWKVAPGSLPAGTYTAVASEPNLLETTDSEPVTFTIDAVPAVTASPSDQVVKAGEEAVFAASASGFPAPSVQWQVSSDGGSSWTDDVGDAGNTTDTLSIASATSGQNGYKYRAVFTNAAGEATSKAAHLEVQSQPVVLTSPSSTTVNGGEDAEFSASASGFPTPAVQWQVSTDAGATWVTDGDPGNKTETLKINSTSAAQNGNRYRAVFTNAAGEATSAAATLEVRSGPSVTESPVAKSVVAGEEAVFKAAASGVPSPAVQWQRSKNGGATWVDDESDAGATTGTLTVTTTAADDGNRYRAVFSNSVGTTATAAASLEVKSAPSITEGPTAKSVKAGETASFKAAASGVPVPAVQWQISTDGGSGWTNDTTDSGNTSGALAVSTSPAKNGNMYRAVFKNALGEATSAAAHLEVRSTPAVVEDPTAESVKAGEPAEFKAAASGVPSPTVQWQVSTDSGGHWASDLSDPGNTSNTLTISAAAAGQNGNLYRAVFKNALGEAMSAAAHLEVRTAPAVTLQPSNRSVVAGEPAVFTVAASGFPVPTVQWQVSSDSGAHWVNDTVDSGANSTKLTVLSTLLSKNGFEYRAVFENALGNAQSLEATLIVSEKKVAPLVVTPPVNRTVTAGETTVFSATASGVPTPSVQWEVLTSAGGEWTNDTTDSGRTSDTLVIEPATAAENGYQYRAVFKNSAGKATSDPATLTVNTPPVLTHVTADAHVDAGQNASFVSAATGSPPPAVQWEESSDGGTSWSSVPGATSPVLSVEGVTPAMNGRQYQAVWSNAAGSRSSRAATLTVDSAPAVTLQPASRSVAPGETATFTAAAAGTPTPEVQWQESSDGVTWSSIPGAVSDTLTLASVPLSDNGHQYRAVFKNVLGEATTEAATLTVTMPVPPAPPAAAPPTASFSWFPASPRVGEAVSLASTSSDTASPLTGFAWDVAGTGAFAPGGSVLTTAFATPGAHAVGLRVTDAAGRSGVVSKTIVVSPPPLTLIQPFPVVRIAGSDNAFGARLSLLSVLAPVGARVTVTCKGRGCPTKPESRMASAGAGRGGVVLMTFRRFQRTLRAGAVLQVRVSKPPQVGKYTSFTIRRAKLPLRVDMCLGPTNGVPMPCPSS